MLQQSRRETSGESSSASLSSSDTKLEEHAHVGQARHIDRFEFEAVNIRVLAMGSKAKW